MTESISYTLFLRQIFYFAIVEQAAFLIRNLYVTLAIEIERKMNRSRSFSLFIIQFSFDMTYLISKLRHDAYFPIMLFGNFILRIDRMFEESLKSFLFWFSLSSHRNHWPDNTNTQMCKGFWFWILPYFSLVCSRSVVVSYISDIHRLFKSIHRCMCFKCLHDGMLLYFVKKDSHFYHKNPRNLRVINNQLTT